MTIHSQAHRLTGMLILPGSSALSTAKRRALLAQIRNTLPTIISVDAIHIHLVHSVNQDAEAELLQPDSPSRRTLNRLLSYGDDIALPGTRSAFEDGSRIIYVLPRLGSVSPWSSKATDISVLCNLANHIKRLEHGVAFVIRIDDGVLSQQDLDLFSPHIHDRMTQIASFVPP